jgi:hypothetical protein
MKDVKASDLCPSLTASLILEISKAGAESWSLLFYRDLDKCSYRDVLCMKGSVTFKGIDIFEEFV